MIIAGCDPGQTGAIALYDTDSEQIVAVYDMPVMAREYGKGEEVNAYELSSIFLKHKPHLAVVELVSSMPKQGVASTFNFGESFGCLKGVLGALQVPVHGITPQRWKKLTGLSGKPKDVSRTLAIKHHPEVSDQLTRKKDHGRADAIHIAKIGHKERK